jgi:hypothetical protein
MAHAANDIQPTSTLGNKEIFSSTLHPHFREGLAISGEYWCVSEAVAG